MNNLKIVEVREKLKKREISCQDLVTDCLEKINSENKKLNALLTVCSDQSLLRAKLADDLIKSDPYIFHQKPLLGIPLSLKDLFVTKGVKTTAGSKVLENYIPRYEGTVVKKLEQAGAIIIGKTNLDAWAHGSSGENSDFGPTRNPYNTDYVPGGSSSGSAVAVATGMSLAATGTDTGGSIRQPASFCNVVGLKPTYGRVSRYGVIAMASSLDSIGHFTTCVEDSALILSVTAGKDKYDATTIKASVPDYLEKLKGEKGIKGLKIGIPKEYFSKGVDSKISNLVNEKIKLLEKSGAEISQVSLPYSQYALAVYYIIQPAEVSSNLARFDGIRYGKNRDCFASEAKRRIMLGTYILSAGYYDAYYLQAMKVRTLICDDFKRVFKNVDALIAPVSPTLPFKIGEKASDPLQMYLSDILTVPINLAGLPALAIPVGMADNFPVGLQVIGPQLSEELLFKIGNFLEKNG